MSSKKKPLILPNSPIIQQKAHQIDPLVVLKTQFEQEKDNMLCTIACLVERLGGTVVIGQSDAEVINMWREHKIVLRVQQIDIQMGHPSFKFTVERMTDKPEPSTPV